MFIRTIKNAVYTYAEIKKGEFMSYRIDKPFSEKERMDFIVKYNHNLGLRIEETEQSMFALEKNEMMSTDSDGNLSPAVNPNYENEQTALRKKEFNNKFFNTSLGWIRRKVRMKDGSEKDFLSDILLQIKAGMELGQKIDIITYLEPDFNKVLTDEYTETLQVKKAVTPEFIQECLQQTVKDFYGG